MLQKPESTLTTASFNTTRHRTLIRPSGTFSRREKETSQHAEQVKTPHTFNNKNSRSHELITRKNVSYSFRFTEI